MGATRVEWDGPWSTSADWAVRRLLRLGPNREDEDPVAIRHTLAHLLPERGNPLEDSRSLTLLTERLRILAAVLLLREVGLTERDCWEGLFDRSGWLIPRV